MIHKRNKAKCFQNFKENAFVDYYININTWETSMKFRSYVHKLEKDMKSQKGKIGLIVDNVPDHSIYSNLIRFN